MKKTITILLIAVTGFCSQAQININSGGFKLGKKKEKEKETQAPSGSGSEPEKTDKADNGNHKKKYSAQEAQVILDKKLDPAFGYQPSLKRLDEIGNQYKSVQSLAKCAADYAKVTGEMNEYESKYGEYCYVIDKNTATGNDDLCFRLKDDQTALANFRQRMLSNYVNADTSYARGTRVFADIIKSAEAEKQSGRKLSEMVLGEHFKEVDVYEGALKFFEPTGTRDQNLEQKKSECSAQLKTINAAVEKGMAEKEEKRLADEKKKRNEEFMAKATRNTCPVDKYTGGDKEALKSIFRKDWKQIQNEENKECNDINILKVYIVWDAWQRTQKKEWHGSSLVNIDESSLLLNVVFQPKVNSAPDIAFVESFFMTKDHINGNKITYSKIPCSAMISLGNPYPIMMKNVK